MKKKSIVLLCLSAACAVVSLSVCNNNKTITRIAGNSPYASVHLPQDVLQTCTVPQDTFDTWFRTGKATENGLVTPANSVTFGHRNNCEFYEWSERMFLWLTSQTSGGHGGETVMESPLFYTVAHDTAGSYKLVKHVPGGIISAVSSLEKNGPNRLPVFRDKNGRLFEVQFHKPGEKVLVKNQSGKIIELGVVEKASNGLAALKDKTGKAIEKPGFVSNLSNPENVVHAFTTAEGQIFLDANGNILTDVAQAATHNALMSQNGSLVYYITMVNDMYAYFLSATRNENRIYDKFPTTNTARNNILTWARKNGYALPPDANALAVEIKTSWIIADSLINQSNFVTMDAMVPTYNTSSDTIWIPNGQRKVKLALVGIHVVGSVAGHPEMVWATFEHASNTPDTAYQYINNKQQVQTIAADAGNFLFAPDTATVFNIPHMRANGDTVKAIQPYTFSASNTQMTFPFGTAFNTRPNQEDTSSAASNSKVISINNSIRSMLPGKDVRKNYLFIGATWTADGTAPNGKVYSIDPTPGSAIGTSLLANSTMETYFVGNTRTCFTCHSGHNCLLPDSLSHIFSKIRPLTATRMAITEKK